MRILLASLLATCLAIPVAAAKPGRGPVSGPEAKAHIGERLQKSSRVRDKTLPMRTQLGGKKGDTVRPFTASNIRAKQVSPNGPTLDVGNRVTGKLNMETGKVRTESVVVPR